MLLAEEKGGSFDENRFYEHCCISSREEQHVVFCQFSVLSVLVSVATFPKLFQVIKVRYRPV